MFFNWMKCWVACAVSSEVRKLKTYIRDRNSEIRELSTSLERVVRKSEDLLDDIDRLKEEIERLNVACGQKDICIEARDNQIMLTDKVVKQQQYMIERDTKLRQLEYLDAKLRVETAGEMSNMAGIKDDSNGTDESGINYRSGR